MKSKMSGTQLFSRAVRGALVVQHGSVKTACERCGTMSGTTMYAKLRDPNNLTIKQLRDLRKICRWSKEEMAHHLMEVL